MNLPSIQKSSKGMVFEKNTTDTSKIIVFCLTCITYSTASKCEKCCGIASNLILLLASWILSGITYRHWLSSRSNGSTKGELALEFTVFSSSVVGAVLGFSTSIED
jgi:hypothetical protein